MNTLQLLGRVVLRLLGERGSALLACETCLAELLNLLERGHPSHQLVLLHLPECGEACVAETRVPAPSIFSRPSRQTHRPCELGVEHVESVLASVDLGEEATTLIMNAHHPILDLHLESTLVKLTDADDVGSEARDVVDVVGGVMLVGFEGEQDDAATLDVDDGTIAKAHRAGDASVDVGERSPGPRHVIGSSGVQDPTVRPWILLVADGGLDLLLHEIDL